MSEQPTPNERWRNRIRLTDAGQPDVRVLPAGTIQPYPFNPKKPSARQQAALDEQLGSLGKTRPLIAYLSERNGGALTLADGHQRQHLDPAEPWPVIVLDITDDEAAQEVALGDEIGQLFERDGGKLQQLLASAKSFTADRPALAALLAAAADRARMQLPFNAPAPAAGAETDAGDPDDLEEPWGDEEAGEETGEEPGAAPPPSHVRMVQLFLNSDTQPVFLRRCQALEKHFGTGTITDTVEEAMRYAVTSLGLE